MEHDLTPPDHVIVIFGANGDLAGRKLLPGLFRLHTEGLLPERWHAVGSSQADLGDAGFRDFARAAVEGASGGELDDDAWEPFARCLSYVAGVVGPGSVAHLADAVAEAEQALGGEPRRLHYLAVPPPAFAPITRALGEAKLDRRARVIYEKPFGLDLRSFRELNHTVHQVLEESQVYRIDHFLGKETVQNILALRFANGMFEPVWNRDHIDHVQIDVPETLGIGTRAGFYERTGALRDMVVTHLFQVLSFVAMEPPTAFEPESLTTEKQKVFEVMEPLCPDDLVLGQYEGYRDTPGVAPGSRTETFVAARVQLENWRWAGVPFFLRSGKRLAESHSAVTLAFREPPRRLFRDAPGERLQTNHVTFEFGPREGIAMSFHAKVPGPRIELGWAQMRFGYEGSSGSGLLEAYERLLHDALMGDRTLFIHSGGIERTWEVVAPALGGEAPLCAYPQGSWGPPEASALIAPRAWHFPDRAQPLGS